MNASSTSLLRRIDEDSDLPVSERIRSRLIRANQRYHANDNISAYVMDGEVDALRTEVEAKMAEVLKSPVIDVESDHNTQGTARRVAKLYLTEVFKGRYHAMPSVTEFPNIEQLNELLIVGPITARSACSHHLARYWESIRVTRQQESTRRGTRFGRCQSVHHTRSCKSCFACPD